jgi:hypothetical protein
VRGPEGIATYLPAPSFERSWSERPRRYFRNAEAEGSSPFTSTKGQVTGLKWDPLKVARRPERYVRRRRCCGVRFRYLSPNLQVNGRQCGAATPRMPPSIGPNGSRSFS